MKILAVAETVSQPLAYAQDGVVFLNHAHVHTAKCFADEGYDDTLKARLDKMETVAVAKLRGVLQGIRDMLISRITRARKLPTPREVRLSRIPEFRSGVRDLLQRASQQGSRDARREVREAKRSAREFAFDPSQPRDENGQWSLEAGAKAIHEMNPDKRDNTEMQNMPGGYHAFLLYEAQKLAPKPVDKLKRVTENNTLGLWQDQHYVANVDGKHFGITKQEDPDASDRDNESGKAFIYSFESLNRHPKNRTMHDTTTNDPAELFRNIRAAITTRQYAEKTPAVFRPRNAMQWMREKEFFVTDLLDSTITNKVKGLLVNALKNGELNSVVAEKIWNAFEQYIGDPNVLRDGEPLSPFRLETIVRTNLTDAYNHGRMMEFTSEEMLPFMTGIRYSAILDDRTTPCCSFLHGKVFSPTDPDLTDLLPPNHFNCRSIVVPVVVGEKINESDFITPDEVGTARSLADAKFLTQEG